MIIRLNDYRLGNKVASLALDQETFQHLLQRHLNVIYLAGCKLYFYPDDLWMDLTEAQATLFKQCDNYDVFQVNSIGQAYRYYDNESVDNAFMLTEQCNSNCIMCPATDNMRKRKHTENVDEVLEIIRHMPSDARHITITGGEPFLLGSRIFEVFSAFKDKCRYTSFLLLTNGRALSYEPFIREFHRTAPKKIIIGIPLHGYDAMTHDAITRSPGGFEQTVRGIRNLINYGFRVELRIVVSKLNYKNITRICQLITERFPEVYRVKLMGLEMLGNAAVNQEEVWIPYDVAFGASKEGIDLLIRNAIQVGLYNFPLCAVDTEYHSIASKSITGYKIRYADECEKCHIKDACGGIFAGTIRLAKHDVKPVILK